MIRNDESQPIENVNILVLPSKVKDDICACVAICHHTGRRQQTLHASTLCLAWAANHNDSSVVSSAVELLGL